MERGPLGELVDRFIDLVSSELAGVSGRPIAELRRDVAPDAAALCAAIIDADGRVTNDELWAYVQGLGPVLDPPLAADPQRLREGGLLAGKSSWLAQPSTLFDILARADARDGGTRSHTYYHAALALAHRVTAVDLSPTPDEIAAIGSFRTLLLAHLDSLGVARPGGAAPSMPSTPTGTSASPGAVAGTSTPGAGAPPSADAAPAQAAPGAPVTAVKAVEPISALLAQLDELVGLAEVKAEIRRLTSLLQIQKLRAERGLPSYETSSHFVFTGNPGTGKTTVARLMSQIFHSLEVVSKGHLVEADRSTLVAGYVGQTAVKTKTVLDSALGGMCLIDEAYALARGGENDFGREAVDTLVKFMEDHRDDIAIIAAGYPTEMQEFIDTNPGLKSRFTRTIRFADYTDDELVEIFGKLGNKHQYVATDGAMAALRALLSTQDRGRGFGNARFIRNVFEASLARQASRLSTVDEPSDEQLTTLIADDIVAPD